MIDINLKGVLYDIVVALPVFRQQRYYERQHIIGS